MARLRLPDRQQRRGQYAGVPEPGPGRSCGALGAGPKASPGFPCPRTFCPQSRWGKARRRLYCWPELPGRAGVLGRACRGCWPRALPWSRRGGAPPMQPSICLLVPACCAWPGACRASMAKAGLALLWRPWSRPGWPAPRQPRFPRTAPSPAARLPARIATPAPSRPSPYTGGLQRADHRGSARRAQPAAAGLHSHHRGDRGSGGKASATVTPQASTLYVEVGGPGNGGAGGWNGGAAGGSADNSSGGGGGGASDVRTTSCGSICVTGGSADSLNSRLVAAAASAVAGAAPQTPIGGPGGPAGSPGGQGQTGIDFWWRRMAAAAAQVPPPRAAPPVCGQPRRPGRSGLVMFGQGGPGGTGGTGVDAVVAEAAEAAATTVAAAAATA